MFGLEILDVVIGLTFVYLLLSLLATAINEYLSAVVNLRGKELARGLGRLLDDLDEKDAVKRAFDGAREKAGTTEATLTQQFYNHPLIRPLATRRGLLFRRSDKKPRLPSYIPARTFAQALLDVLGVKEKDASLGALLSATAPATSGAGTTAPAATIPANLVNLANQDNLKNLAKVLQILKRESPQDISEHVGDLEGWLENAILPPDAKVRLLEGLTASQTQLQKLHDSVEVWFNNSMDRVSGAYKRNIQGWLFMIGAAIALAANADTIDMWRRLSEDDKLREGMAARAIASMASLDSAVHPRTAAATGNPAAVDSARVAYTEARARLDSLELKLGWTRHEAMRIGLMPIDTTFKGNKPAWALVNPSFWGKLLGLLLTAIALTLGAPFWFDVLNKVISIRSAGRSPMEKPKSPEGPPKRPAEHTPR